MLPAIIGAGISAAAGLFGASENRKAQEAANRAMLEDKEKDRALQREFAQSGIQWRSEDAKKAGIHPIYALGSGGASYTPSAIQIGAATDGGALASAGQNIGSAISRTMSQGGRTDAFTKAVQTLTLEKGALENELLRSQVARMNATQSPPMPVGDKWLLPGQTGSRLQSSLDAPTTLIDTNAMKRTASDPSRRWSEPGAINDVGYARTSGGAYPIPSSDVKERIEDNFWHESAHFARNNLLPMISPKFNDPPHAAPKGQAWVFNPLYGYKLVPDKWHRKFFRY